MDTSLTAALSVGFLLGIRHATDADHIAAVSTFVSDDRGWIRSCLIGTFWGAGHTAALFIAGLITIGLKITISPALERTFETLVACVLILLGSHVVLRAMTVDQRTPHRHRHLLEAGRRPFLVGLLHGMAGSAALMLVILATIPSPVAGLVYIAVFGLGSTAGMLALSGLIAVPFALTRHRSPHMHTVVRAGAGVASVALGLWLLAAQP
jgi:high-affinity nickel permease